MTRLFRVRVLLAFAPLPAVFALAQVSRPAPAPAAASHSYADLKLHYRYTYSPNLKPGRPPSADDSKQAGLDCTTYPMLIPEGAQTPNFGAVTIIQLDMDCSKEPSTKEFNADRVRPMLEGALKEFGTPVQFGSARAYMLGSHPAEVIDALVPHDNSTAVQPPVYGAVVCTLVEHTSVCWLSISSVSLEHARQILVGQIQFAEGPSMALVPSNLLR